MMVAPGLFLHLETGKKMSDQKNRSKGKREESMLGPEYGVEYKPRAGEGAGGGGGGVDLQRRGWFRAGVLHGTQKGR